MATTERTFTKRRRARPRFIFSRHEKIRTREGFEAQISVWIPDNAFQARPPKIGVTIKAGDGKVCLVFDTPEHLSYGLEDIQTVLEQLARETTIPFKNAIERWERSRALRHQIDQPNIPAQGTTPNAGSPNNPRPSSQAIQGSPTSNTTGLGEGRGVGEQKSAVAKVGDGGATATDQGKQ